MDFIIKKASAFSSEEQAARGITGIPQDWPVEKYVYETPIPDGFEAITQEDLDTLIYNNQAAYDAWLASKMQAAPIPAPEPVTIITQPPFGSKTILVNGVTKRLFARFTGIQQSLNQGTNTISYTMIYPWAKILGVEVINCEALDYVDFKVYDNSQGTYSGVPNLMLNQFSFSLNLPKDYYQRMAQFDADIYQGMVLEITYNSISAKTVGVNFLINEAKT